MHKTVESGHAQIGFWVALFLLRDANDALIISLKPLSKKKHVDEIFKFEGVAGKSTTVETSSNGRRRACRVTGQVVIFVSFESRQINCARR